MKSKAINYLPVLLAVIVLFLGTIVRYDRLAYHFGHLDDLGVALTIFESEKKDILDSIAIKRISALDQSSISQGALLGIPNAEVNQYRFAASLKRLGATDILESPFFDATIRAVNPVLHYFSVPIYWTYAPLQFLMTHFLLSENQGYREVLFWGRFPSMVFGVLSLVLLLIFYKRRGLMNAGEGLFALALLAFSWEAVIFSKQMHNYSLGVFASTCLLVFLMDEGFCKVRGIMRKGLKLALLSCAHYQMVFLMPAFIGALWLKPSAEPGTQVREYRKSLLKIIFFWLFFAFPSALIFLIPKASKGVNGWNRGVFGEYVFLWESSRSFVDSFFAAGYFFIKNFIVVVNSQIAFVNENSFNHPILSLVFPALIISGLCWFLVSKDRKDVTLGFFFLLVFLSWIFLTMMGKITLSPTRHSLILLPFFSVLVQSGVSFACAGLKKYTRMDLSAGINVVLTLVVTLFFLFSYPAEMQRRTDPFVPEKIKEVLARYDVKTVIGFEGTIHLSLMPEIVQAYQYLDERFRLPRAANVRFQDLGATIALISHKRKLDSHVRKDLSELIFRESGIKADLNQYELIHSQEVSSATEIEFSSKTRNGTNGYYFYVLRQN